MPEETVLAEIAQAGYDGAPGSPQSNQTAEEVLSLFGRHGLKPAPGYLSGAFGEPDQKEPILGQARHYAQFMREVGCTELYVAAGGCDWTTPRGLTRRQTAGHVRAEDSLSDEQYRQFADTLNQVGEITLAEGVRSCFHNHVGTPIETREEIDHLLALVDPEFVFLGPDTGHLAWAGADVVAFCRDYSDRILTLHIKDIDPDVLAQGQQGEWDYKTFSDRGIFTELGRGFVDFPSLFEILEQANFQGWLIVETDVTQQPSALESAQISRDYLKKLGY